MKDFTHSLVLTKMDHKTRIIEYEHIWVVPCSVQNLSNSVIKGDAYTPTKGDRIWFYPGCDVPRFKVKQFCVKNDIAVVKYAEKANVKFIGPETIKELVKIQYTHSIPKVDFLKWFDTIMCNAYIEIRELIVKSPNDVIYLEYDARNAFTGKDCFGKNTLDDDLTDHNNILYCTEENHEKLLVLQQDPLIRSQDTILSLLNTGIILDEQMYNDIHRLFESSDKENTKLAMEAMANCDFQKSAVYLLLLMKEYGQKISDSGNRHHVNFKSLIKYFQVTNLENMTVDNMINSLRGQKLLSVDNLNRLMPLAMERIRQKGDMHNIKIKDVELSEEAELSVAENILDQQIPTPSVPVPETPEHNTLFADVKEPF